jgi:hypothetical protein
MVNGPVYSEPSRGLATIEAVTQNTPRSHEEFNLALASYFGELVPDDKLVCPSNGITRFVLARGIHYQEM